ncbi:MAG: hypothetical protein IKI50_03820 [Clostridia bacterium]|nr:hypothetical protein [Clostridia bacterium]
MDQNISSAAFPFKSSKAFHILSAKEVSLQAGKSTKPPIGGFSYKYLAGQGPEKEIIWHSGACSIIAFNLRTKRR